MTNEQAKVKADILKALAHPVRIILVDALSRGDMCVCDLNELVNVDQSGVSRHLSILKNAGIVSERRDGMRVIHHLETPCILNAVGCAENVLSETHIRKAGLLREDINNE